MMISGAVEFDSPLASASTLLGDRFTALFNTLPGALQSAVLWHQPADRVRSTAMASSSKAPANAVGPNQSPHATISVGGPCIGVTGRLNVPRSPTPTLPSSSPSGAM